MKQVNTGVIGCGFMGEIHLRGYLDSMKTSVIGIFDVDTNRAREIAEKYHVRAFGSLDELLNQTDLQAVSICTTDQYHVEPSLKAFRRKKHVLLEKPIATTLEDADRIIQSAENEGVKLMIGHIVRFFPQYKKLKEISERGELGDIISIFTRRVGNVDVQDILKGRISVLSFLGVHDFDYILWLMKGKPISVYTAETSKYFKSLGLDIEDNTFTLIQFDNGATACVEAGWILPRNMPRKAAFQVEALGSKGCALIDLNEQGLQLCEEEKGYTRPALNTIPEIIGYEIDHFLDCVLLDKDPLIGGEDGKAALKIALAAQESVKNGKKIEI